MKKTLSAVLALLLAVCLIVPALASEDKAAVSSSEEVIYAMLDAAGAPQTAYSVTAVNVSGAGMLTRWGDFTAVKNLTDASAVDYSGGMLTADAAEGRFYYQGDLKSAEMPWLVDITYMLNGRAAEPGELGGKTGALEIHISTARNDAVQGDYFDHYLLQVSVTLDAERCVNIAADGASVAMSGGNKQVTFTVLPGGNGKLSLTADVTDFEMEGMTIAAVPYDLSSAMGDVSELTDGLTQLSDAAAQLADGAKKLSDGTANLSVGAAQLKTGAEGFGEGVAALSGSGDTLVSSSLQILYALRQMNDALTGVDGGVDLSALSRLPSALGQLSAAMGQISDGLARLSEAYPAAYKALGDAVSAIPAPSVTEADIGALMAANPNSAALKALADNYAAAQTVRAVWQQTSAAFDAVSVSLPALKSGADTVKSGLDAINSQLAAAMQSSDALSGLSQLTQGMAALAANYAAFNDGLVSYTSGVDSVAQGWGELGDGIAFMAEGSYALQKGSKELSDGAGVLSGETAKIPGQIEELTGGENNEKYVPASFLSEKNTDCASVQFVLKTAAIEAPAAGTSETVPAAPNTLWNRILSLFSWIG